MKNFTLFALGGTHFTHFFFFLPLAIIWQCTPSSADHESARDLSTPHLALESVFHAFQNNDSSAFIAMTATSDELKSFFYATDSVRGRNRSPQELNQYLLERAEDKQHFLKAFIDIEKEGMADGITDWSKVKFERGTFEDVKDNPIIYRYPKIEFSYTKFTGNIHLSVLLIKSQRGWVLAHPARGLWGPNYQKMYPSLNTN